MRDGQFMIMFPVTVLAQERRRIHREVNFSSLVSRPALRFSPSRAAAGHQTELQSVSFSLWPHLASGRDLIAQDGAAADVTHRLIS